MSIADFEMKVLWLITLDEYSQARFEQALATSRTGVDYVVRRAADLSQVPESHLAHTGVIFVLDAFNPSHPGFEGLKKLRSLGFAGHVFVAGEPSPETAEEAFKKYHLSGFFGTLDRIDYTLAGGILHTCFIYQSELDLRPFLEEGGRASEEDITSAADFTHFVKVLGSFVARFGISEALVKKVLMGMSLGYMKMGPGGPAFDGKFRIQFGVDRRKLILSVRGNSKGSNPDGVLSGFTDSVLSLGANVAPKNSLFPDMAHTVRSARSLHVFSGNFEQADPGVDPLSLLTVVAFPDSVASNEISVQWFGYCHVKKTDDMPFELTQAPLNEGVQAESTQQEIPLMDSGPRPMAEADIQKILGDSAVVSTPEQLEAGFESTSPEALGVKFEDEVQREPAVEENASEGDSENAQNLEEASSSVVVDEGKIAELNVEIEELKKVGAAMAADIRRLMKERKEPSTDKELREAKQQLEETNKQLLNEKRQLQKLLSEKEKEIESLKGKAAA